MITHCPLQMLHIIGCPLQYLLSGPLQRVCQEGSNRYSCEYGHPAEQRENYEHLEERKEEEGPIQKDARSDEGSVGERQPFCRAVWIKAAFFQRPVPCASRVHLLGDCCGRFAVISLNESIRAVFD